MNFPRVSGVLLHPTSFPSKFGIGDFGREAFEVIDFLVKSKQTYWQVLPLGQTGYGDSPYQCFSAFAGNIYLISPELLIRDGVLKPEDVANAQFPDDHVDYGPVIQFKVQMLERA